MNINQRNVFVEEHYRSQYSTLVKRVRYRVPDNSLALAEEVVQEAYLRAIKYFSKYDPELGNFDQWLSVILNNVTNQMKKDERSKGVVHEIDAAEEFHETPEELTVLPVERKQRFRQGLNKAIQAESERDRMILIMFYFDGFSGPEIAEFLNIRWGNVKVIIHRFREKLIALPQGIV